jgi:hypothetical protein
MTKCHSITGYATGAVRVNLQLEGLAIAAAGCVAFAQTGASWWLFAAVILAPDLAMIGYALGPRIGAFCYNLAHTYLAPAILAAAAWGVGNDAMWPLVWIWVVHIAADRTLGYGLKYAAGFKSTHLSHI